MTITVERNGRIIDLTLRPLLDKSTGAGKIGVYFWTDPVIGAVTPGSPGSIAGIQPGDRILRANGQELPYSVALLSILEDMPSELSLEFERNGQIKTAEIPLAYTDGVIADIGLTYQTIHYHTPSYSIPGAIAKGAEEAWKTLVISLRSLALLFRGIDLTQAVSGPVRITYMLGDAAAAGFGQSVGTGLSSMASFLSLISISLAIMNLLPLPVLDGGQIVLFIVELIKGHPLRPKAIYAFQTVGVVLIFGLMIFAVFGDILFLAHR
jgi:regulator of sigma E protease